MPAKGLDFYELQYGGQAKKLLTDAKKTSDPQLLATVAQRFYHTEAGAEATDLLGTYHLDRGRALMAALCYDHLLRREGADQLPPLTLYKAALAFRLAGDASGAASAADASKRLAARVGRDGLRIGDETVPLADLQKELERAIPGEVSSPYVWAMFMGNPSRSAKGRGSTRSWKANGKNLWWLIRSIPKLGAGSRTPAVVPTSGRLPCCLRCIPSLPRAS